MVGLNVVVSAVASTADADDDDNDDGDRGDDGGIDGEDDEFGNEHIGVGSQVLMMTLSLLV